MNKKNYISDFIPSRAETGAGLALRDKEGKYVFFLAAPRHRCRPKEFFFAGIGGHLQNKENWIDCAEREAMEELGSRVKIKSSNITWYIDSREEIFQIKILDIPQPYIIYEMIHPEGTSRHGEKYYIVIFKSRLENIPDVISSKEMSGLIAIKKEQVVKSLSGSFRIIDFIDEGATFIRAIKNIDFGIKLFPLGTARALGLILRQIECDNFQKKKD